MNIYGRRFMFIIGWSIGGSLRFNTTFVELIEYKANNQDRNSLHDFYVLSECFLIVS